MFREAGRVHEVLEAMTVPFRLWLQPRLERGDYFGWIVEHKGVAVAGVGMMLIDWPPNPSHPTQDRHGYVLNVFVDPAHRGKGLAKELMRLTTDEARRRGLQLMVLHATEMGRPLYEKLGWTPTAEMRLELF
jgi:GNAT superfamily N-acetyltransferase